MDEQKKEISVDNILREYEAMAEEPVPSRQSSRTEIRSGGRHSSPRLISPIRRLRRRPTGRQRRRPRTGGEVSGHPAAEKRSEKRPHASATRARSRPGGTARYMCTAMAQNSQSIGTMRRAASGRKSGEGARLSF